MTHEPLGSDNIETAQMRLLMKLQRSRSHFQLLASGEREVGGERALYARCSYANGTELVDKTIVLIAPPPSDPERLVTMFVLTCAGEREAREAFETVLASVRFPYAASARARTPPSPKPSLVPIPGHDRQR